MKQRTCKILLLTLAIVVAALSQTNRHVVLVIIDGARYSETLGDSLAQFTPRMHQLAQQGVVADMFVNDSITVTKSAIPAIWCGSWAKSKDTTVNGYANQYATVPTVWEYFRKARGVDSTQAMYIMKYLTTPWIQSFHPDYGQKYWPWYILEGSSDISVWQNALTKMQAYHPTLTVLYLPDVDSYGGTGVWASYTQAIRTADSIVGLTWDLIQSDPVFQNRTTLLVTNDHGRHDDTHGGFRSHGDGCWGCRHIMFLGVGDGVPKAVHVSARHAIPDITPTIGALLQFSTPYASGTPMLDILSVVETQTPRAEVPTSIHLEQNYPNPFNPTTSIHYQTRLAGHVLLNVYDILGNEIATLVDGMKDAGTYEVQFEAGGLSGGVYFYRLAAGGCTAVKKLVLIK